MNHFIFKKVWNIISAKHAPDRDRGTGIHFRCFPAPAFAGAGSGGIHSHFPAKAGIQFLIPLLLLLAPDTLFSNQIPATDIIATDKNGELRNLQDILDQILPTNDGVDLSDLTATAAELNVLHGISTNVTAANLNALTGGGATALHSHGGGSTTLDGAYDNDTTGNAQITVDARDVSFDLNDATNDYKVQIDNTTTGAIADALFFNTSGAGGTFTDSKIIE